MFNGQPDFPAAVVGTLVRDRASGRVGVLMAVESYADPVTRGASPYTVYLRPRGGGREWTTDPEMVTPVQQGGPCTHPVVERHSDGKTYCAVCGAQLYL
ncbi:hypothetical protein [Streptomyces boncukensis]|uniref:Uncharacterized protein n=1 Tax=Streptomyces boncukensis TaxID=2711219 RepID=A0A6G4WZE4_9ACTN|nr:hypothetical protein [Streptomyces boncukensis]NGO70656.1 hypothetical protein [Streptomyces boncukensis]